MYFLLLLSLCVLPAVSHECHHELDVLWISEAGSGPVVSPPLVADVNGDGIKDVISATFDGTVSVVDGRNGLELPGWPVQFHHKTFHSGPLMYDINNDGVPEVLVCSSDGDIFFISSSGSVLEEDSIQLPFLWVRKGWYQISLAKIMQHDDEGYEIQKTPDKITRFVPASTRKDGFEEDVVKPGVTPDGLGVLVDKHVLSTPILVDIDGDQLHDELVVPVNYYFDPEFYNSADKLESLGLTQKDLSQYAACGMVIYNLWTHKVIFNITLELTLASSDLPGLWMSSPTLVYEHDKNKKQLISLAAGTSQGNVHLVSPGQSKQEQHKIVFSSDSILTQVISGDVIGQGFVELVSVDNSGNLVCLGTDGTMLWESAVTGSSPGGLRLADVDGDGKLDVVVASNDGYLWVLSGETGKVSSPWPLKLEGRIQSPVLLTKLTNKQQAMDIIVPSFSGLMFVATGDGHCVDSVDVGMSSLVQILADDLIPSQPGLELLLATTQGSLLVFGSKNSSSSVSSTQQFSSWPSETLPCGRFTSLSDEIGIQILDKPELGELSSGGQVSVKYRIINNRTAEPQRYDVMLVVGQRLVVQAARHRAVGEYQTEINIPPGSTGVHLVARLTVNQLMCFEDSVFLSFSVRAEDDLKWILLVPFLVMASTLLFLYGFPQTDLLPQTSRAVDR